MPKPTKLPLQIASQAPAAPSSDAVAKTATSPRRTFSAKEKLRIVREADACTERGQIEALLRREGIYSSQLSAWRTALRLYGEKGFAAGLKGRPPTRDDKDERLALLERDNARLHKELSLAKELLALQKKVSELLGLEMGRS